MNELESLEARIDAMQAVPTGYARKARTIFDDE